MRTVPITWRRSNIFGLTDQVYKSSLGLIVRDHRRDELATWEKIRNSKDTFKIAIENTPGNLLRSRAFFPDANITLLKDMDDHRSELESERDDIDAIADMAEEGAAWTLLYPGYSLVVPKPPIFSPVSYAVSPGNNQLLNALNAWLLAAKSQGEIDELYRYWMHGEATKVKKEPRWSILRDVLGWVE